MPAPPAPTPAPARPSGSSRPSHARRSTVVLAVLLVLVGIVGTGCVRVRAGLAVSTDDLVSGQVDVGTPDGSPDGAGPPIRVPSDLAGDVEVTRYEQDGYVGSRLNFSDLTFDETSRVLPSVSPNTTSAVRVRIQRIGDRVVVSGQVDLTRVAADSADVQLKMAFPGAVRQTDGTVSQGVVSWSFPPGAVTDVNAVVEYPDPNAPSWVMWALLLFALVAVAALVVFALAASERPTSRSRARR